jgi:hypothetical protein
MEIVTGPFWISAKILSPPSTRRTLRKIGIENPSPLGGEGGVRGGIFMVYGVPKAHD